MAITPSQWSHVLTIPESYTPSAATSGQTLVITESVIAKLSASDQTTFWSNVQNGGGDVRICENSDGTNQLPVEVVSLDNSAQTCVIWTRKPTYSGTGDLHLFIGKAGETQPPVTDPFGRNAVWVDYAIVYHFSESAAPFLDSTGNGSSIATTNDITTDLQGQIGKAVKTGGSNSLLESSTPSTEAISDITLSTWLKIEGVTGAGPNNIVSIGGANNGAQLFYRNGPDTFSVQTSTSSELRSSFTLADNSNTWAMIHATASSDALQIYANGSLNSSSAGSAPTGAHDGSLSIGSTSSSEVNANQPCQQTVFDEVRITRSVLPSNYITTEYNNQNDPASFFGTPTLATTGGGGGAVTVDGATTLPSLTATGNASATLPQPSLSASISLTQLSATGSASATLPQPDASGSIVFNAPTITGSATATLPQPTLQAAITLPVVTANGNASATLPGFNLSASVNMPTLTATGEAQATLPQPVVSASITMPSLKALGAAEATEPSFTVSGNVTLQPPTVTGSVSATLPQPSISGNIALPSIQASGFIIGGEIVITVELETNINEPQLSVNITEPTLSTNITE